jgi:protein-histidine N-methyltransferase
MCVCSRNFGLIVNGIRTAALVPYADMLNHFRPRETKWQFEDSRQGFTIITLNKISTGAQVYDSYGQKCNHRFLLNYGFSIENNTEEDGYCPNEVPLLFHLLREDPLYDRKCSIWHRDTFIPSRRLRLGVVDNENFRYALAMLRIIVANENDLNKVFQMYGNHTYRSVRDIQIPIDQQNEIRAMEHFRDMCLDYLSRSPLPPCLSPHHIPPPLPTDISQLMKKIVKSCPPRHN